MRRRRLAGTAAAGVVVLAAVGCSERSLDASQAGKDLPDCSPSGCAEQIAPIAEDLASLPGVVDLDLRYREEQATAGASVVGRIDVRDDATCEDLEDDLGRSLWQSRVSPVSSIRLDCHGPGSAETGYEVAGYAFVLKDAAALEEAWGPRGG